MTAPPDSAQNSVMSRIALDIEWGETLIRPCAYPDGADPAFWGEPAEAGDLLERYQRAERDFLAVQAELREIARRRGDLE